MKPQKGAKKEYTNHKYAAKRAIRRAEKLKLRNGIGVKILKLNRLFKRFDYEEAFNRGIEMFPEFSMDFWNANHAKFQKINDAYDEKRALKAK